MGRIPKPVDNQRKKRKKQLIVLAALLVLAAPVWLRLLVRDAGPRSAKATPAADKAPTTADHQTLEPVAVVVVDQLGRDLFSFDAAAFEKAPVAAPRPEPVKPVQPEWVVDPAKVRRELKLQAIFDSSAGQVRAIINGEVYMAGSRIKDDYVVEEIRRRQVVIRVHGQTVTLGLDQ